MRSIAAYLQRLSLGLLLLFPLPGLPAQEQQEDYNALFAKGDFQRALVAVEKRLREIYSTRVDDKRVPSGFITMKDADKEINLVNLFTRRKVDSFFIEEHKELSTLHLVAARSYAGLRKYNYALSHYIQCLRFKHLEYNSDDRIFYEIARIFREQRFIDAYRDTLEKAWTLNPTNAAYSLELALSLYGTAQKKKAIYHLERYLSMSADEPDPALYLKLGNLNEDIGRYLETEKYYRKYLEKKPHDGATHFALGCIALQRTGNHTLAAASFDQALRYLPEGDLTRRARSHECKGDIEMSELAFGDAIASYRETIGYQERLKQTLDAKKQEVDGLTAKINDLKTQLLKEQDAEKYARYENSLVKKGELELALNDIEVQYKKLNPGRIRWNIADCHEHLEQLEQAIGYYREALFFDYRSNDAREKIVKLQLKLKRGY